MSRTLHLIRRLLARARKLHKLGIDREAKLLLSKLAGFRDLPGGVAEEVQRRLAALLLKQRKYARARRHLAAVLLTRPDSARYHHLMGRAFAKDAKAGPKKAIACYRRAAALSPDCPRYLADLGLAAVRAGRAAEGLRSLRRALELAPDDAAVVARAAAGLGEHGHGAEALTAVRSAMFRNPREQRFRRLADGLRFRQARAEQESARRKEAAADASDHGPTLLPFVAAAGGAAPVRPPRGFRLDAAATLPHPHLPRAARPKDQKHAQ